MTRIAASAAKMLGVDAKTLPSVLVSCTADEEAQFKADTCKLPLPAAPIVEHLPAPYPNAPLKALLGEPLGTLARGGRARSLRRGASLSRCASAGARRSSPTR